MVDEQEQQLDFYVRGDQTAKRPPVTMASFVEWQEEEQKKDL